MRHGGDHDGGDAEGGEFVEGVAAGAEGEVGLHEEVVEVLDVTMRRDEVSASGCLYGFLQGFVMREAAAEDDVDVLERAMERLAHLGQPPHELDGRAVEVDAAHRDADTLDVFSDGLFLLAIGLQFFGEREVFRAAVDLCVCVVVPIVRVHHRVDDDVAVERAVSELVDADERPAAAKAVEHAVRDGAEIEHEHVRPYACVLRHHQRAVRVAFVHLISERNPRLECCRAIRVDEK